MEREKKKYSEYDPPITITQAEITQHYLKEVLKRPDIFGKECFAEWFKKTNRRPSMASTGHPF